jgi:hypothetical protein
MLIEKINKEKKTTIVNHLNVGDLFCLVEDRAEGNATVMMVIKDGDKILCVDLKNGIVYDPQPWSHYEIVKLNGKLNYWEE